MFYDDEYYSKALRQGFLGAVALMVGVPMNLMAIAMGH